MGYYFRKKVVEQLISVWFNIGLAWDCGAVTTGPVFLPLVLALGIGVCRIVGNNDSKSSGVADAGFGIVTLASLLPILAVLRLLRSTASAISPLHSN